MVSCYPEWVLEWSLVEKGWGILEYIIMGCFPYILDPLMLIYAHTT